MPEKRTLQRARADKREGKPVSTQAGEFVREEMHHIREGRHGARSSKQAIAIGLSKARHAGVELPAPPRGELPAATRRKARQDPEAGEQGNPGKRAASKKRSRATTKALKREGRSATRKSTLSKKAKTAARKRTTKTAAKKAVRTKGTVGRSSGARKSPRTRHNGAAAHL